MIASESWQRQANCQGVDPEVFFAADVTEAKAICRGCTVRSECLDYAIRYSVAWGVWGGLSERDRRKIKRAAA